KADGVWDLLGYGYDATRSFMDDNSCSDAPIIDVSRFSNDYLSRLDIGRNTEMSYNYYAGETITDYLKELNQKRSKGIEVTIGSKDSIGKGYFSASINKDNNNYSKDTYY